MFISTLFVFLLLTLALNLVITYRLYKSVNEDKDARFKELRNKISSVLERISNVNYRTIQRIDDIEAKLKTIINRRRRKPAVKKPTLKVEKVCKEKK